MKKFTVKEIPHLEILGWGFYPTGLNEWDWIKFAEDGTQLGRCGDPVWNADVAIVINASRPPKPLTRDQLLHLDAMGWNFCQADSGEYEWVKFDKEGNVVAYEASMTWEENIATVIGD